MHGFFRWSHVFHDFLLVSGVFKVVIWVFMDFGWFPPFFKVTSWILVGSPGFLCGFCFFLVFGFVVSYMIWKASVCHVEEKNQNRQTA